MGIGALFLYSSLIFTAAVGVAATTGVLGIADLSKPDEKVAALERLQQQQAALVPKAEEPEVKPEAAIPEPEKPDPTLPTIHVFRAEKDGSFVLAGNAAAGSTVELRMADGTVVATTTAGPSGDFVFVSEGILPGGVHELRLFARTDSGLTRSQDTAILSIPEKAKDTLIAAVVPENQPIKIFENSAPEPTLEPAPEQKSREVAPEPEKPPVVQKPKTAASTQKVAIEAVEVEGKQLVIAGAAKSGAVVRLYVDNKPVGTARGTPDGRFVLETPRALPAGRHNIRADVVEKGSGAVVARAAVPVLHQTERQEEEAEVLETGTSVIIRGGDSLWRLSRNAYGAGIRYTTIFEANRDQIRDPDRIYIGQIFRIPDSKDDGNSEIEVN